MQVGIATDHGGFSLKEDLAARLRAAGYEVIDFGAIRLDPNDDYPDFVVPLAALLPPARSNAGSQCAAAELARPSAPTKCRASAPPSSTIISPPRRAWKTIT